MVLLLEGHSCSELKEGTQLVSKHSLMTFHNNLGNFNFHLIAIFVDSVVMAFVVSEAIEGLPLEK